MIGHPQSAFAQFVKNGQLHDALVALVEDRDTVSFVEIQQAFEGHMPVHGDIGMEIAPNVILWAGMSQELIDLIRRVSTGPTPRIEPRPSVPLVYLIDGAALALPIAKRIPKKGYTKPHWLPIVFRPAQRPA